MNESKLACNSPTGAATNGTKVLSFYGGNKPLKNYFKNRNYCAIFAAF